MQKSIHILHLPGDFCIKGVHIDVDAYDRKVLNTCLTAEGRLKAFPAQKKKEEAVLRYAAGKFEPGRHFTEKEVNAILSDISEDTARLWRNLVTFGFMEREGGGGKYRLMESSTRFCIASDGSS